MRLCRVLVCGLGLLLLPLAARADDASYCAALGDLAWRYIAAGATDGASKPDLETKAAIAECEQGHFAVGIPILERKLRDNGITLPKRSTARAERALFLAAFCPSSHGVTPAA